MYFLQLRFTATRNTFLNLTYCQRPFKPVSGSANCCRINGFHGNAALFIACKGAVQKDKTSHVHVTTTCWAMSIFQTASFVDGYFSLQLIGSPVVAMI